MGLVLSCRKEHGQEAQGQGKGKERQEEVICFAF
jgi:hypothetical protein